MADLDYKFVQDLINFGRGLAGDIVGQPFSAHRLNALSVGDVFAPGNQLDDISAKVTHSTSRVQTENDMLHANMFDFLMSSENVATEDILTQKDDVYGGNTSYFVSSLRPLKRVMCIRAEHNVRLLRTNSNRTQAGGYSGNRRSGELPFHLVGGQFVIATGTEDPEVVATPIPAGLTNIGQIKDRKISMLPMDVTTSWWYLMMPLFPGLDRVRENDVVEVDVHDDEPVVRYRIVTPLIAKVGTRGVFALCQRVSP